MKRQYLIVAFLTLVLALAPTGARAQDIEPRSFSNAPVGVNFLIGGYAYTRGGLAFDSATHITNPQLTTSNAVVGFARVLDLWGMSGKFDAIVPYSWLSGSAQYQGQAVEREVDGFGDPRFRLSVNFHGAPALGLKDFRQYQQDLIVGASLQVSAPWGRGRSRAPRRRPSIRTTRTFSAAARVRRSRSMRHAGT